MKNTAQLTQQAVMVIQSQNSICTAEPVILDEHRRLIDVLFERLRVLFPAAAPEQSVIGSHKTEWLKTLAFHKVLSSPAIQTGLMRARADIDRKFWPSPLQFANWCKGSPEDHNLPSCDAAFREAVRNYRDRKTHNWSHALVYSALQQVGSWAFSQASEKELRAQFEHAYTQLVRRFMSGQPIDIELPKALPQPGESCRIADPDCEGRLRALRFLGRTA